MKYFLLLIVPVFFHFTSAAQNDTARWVTPAAHTYSFIKPAENTILRPQRLASFFEELYALHTVHKGVVRIVHIGDSHLQADGITSILRKGFQDYFGNAGRGITFPYQLAKSNAPGDISASSNITWQYNRLAHPEIATVTGVSGFGIHTNSKKASVHMALKPVDSVQHTFDHLVFFVGKDSDCYTLSSPNQIKPLTQYTHPGIDTPSLTFDLDSPATEFDLAKCASGGVPDTYSFYGVSMERNNVPGVIYHTIGCNGAQYEQYTNNALYWEQLRALKGELFIVSMGTNEAQNQQFNEVAFMAKCDSFVAQVHTIAPNAMILLTTPAGSYYKAKKPNVILEKVAHALLRYCEERNLPCWDLYHISSGTKGTAAWKRSNLFSHDLVHYNAAGYQLQGQLFLNALVHAYNDYVKHRPKDKPLTDQHKKEKKPIVKPVTKPAPVKKAEPVKVTVPAAPAPDTLTPPPPPKHHIIKVKIEDK